MADVRLRELERAARQGDEDAALALLGQRLRGVGEPVDPVRLELAAFLLAPVGPELLQRRLVELPSAWAPEAEVPLNTAGRYPGASLRATLTCLDPARDAARLTITGYLGSRSAPWFDDLFREVVQLGVRHALLDLRQGSGINSGGFGALLRLHQALERQEGSLVVSVPDAVRTVIQLLGLGAFFPVAESLRHGRELLRERTTDAAPVLDGDAWLGRLLRWGTAPCLRAALAVARAQLDPDAPPPEAYDQALHAAAAWLAQPDAHHAREARAALEAAADAARELARPHAALAWAHRAAALAATGIWPSPAPEPLPAQLNLVRRTLLVWSLGL